MLGRNKEQVFSLKKNEDKFGNPEQNVLFFICRDVKMRVDPSVILKNSKICHTYMTYISVSQYFVTASGMFFPSEFSILHPMEGRILWVCTTHTLYFLLFQKKTARLLTTSSPFVSLRSVAGQH